MQTCSECKDKADVKRGAVNYCAKCYLKLFVRGKKNETNQKPNKQNQTPTY
jgi:hypothetical protein